MRNLLEYPITKEEKLLALNYALKLMADERPIRLGDIRLPALKTVIKEVEAQPE